MEQLQEWKNDNDPRIQEKSRIKKDEIVPYGWNEPNGIAWVESYMLDQAA